MLFVSLTAEIQVRNQS